MRGIFVHNQLEYRLEVKKDQFEQGDTIPCVLSVKNHGKTPQTVTDLRLDLCRADIKSVRERKFEQFETIAPAAFTLPWEIQPGQDQNAPWTFELDKNCLVSDKAKSLYFLFGTTSGALNQLPLTVQAHAHIRTIVTILETSFQFVLKGQKSADGWVETKLKPPSARRFMMVNELLLNCRFEGPELVQQYVFNVKKMDPTTQSLTLRRGKSEITQRLEEAKYTIPGGFVNHDVLEASINEALNTVSSGI
jgi:hypothetical protein